MSNHLIAIVGPTGIGKTSLSLKLAQIFNTEIISADSRQFYKEMQIGTAAPTAEELQAAPHHFIHNISVEDDYSVGDFEKEALQTTEELYKSRSLLILVGGSGLYVKSLIEGLDNFPEVDPAIRERLNLQMTEDGLDALKKELERLDPDHYSQIDVENPHRIIRALEICLGTGLPYSSFLKGPKSPRKFKTIKIGLTAPRNIIYDRINERVDSMMDEGLLEEARRLYPLRNLNALNTVGYKELFAFVEGKFSLEEAVGEIKKNTRRFAKRQLTWFRKEKDITWFDYRTPAEEVKEFLDRQIKNSNI